MIQAGTILQNRYEIIKPIGQGGMGAVYLARDQRLGNTVALKETFFLDAMLLAAFEREARLLAGLRHVALPKVFDHFADTSGQFLVMEYIPGDDLQELIRESGGATPVGEVLHWADQILDALDYLHSQQPPIIHRDIKPQNLKLTSRNQVVLLDFGLAKGTALEMTNVGSNPSIFGYTPSYAPLEQAQGSGTDPRSDIYSLGATLYHILTGVKPIDAMTRASCILNGQPDPLPPASEVNQSIPAALNRVVMSAVALKKDDRPSSAVEMRRMLSEAARPGGHDVAAHVQPQPHRPDSSRNSHPATSPGSSTRMLASPSATPAAGLSKDNSYTTRASATQLRQATRAQVAEKSLNQLRPATAAQRKSPTVIIPAERASGLSKAIVAGLTLIIAVTIIAVAFKPGPKSESANATPIIIQKVEQVPAPEQPNASAKTAGEVPGAPVSRTEPVSPSAQPAREEQPPSSDDNNGKPRGEQTGQAADREEPRREDERAETKRPPEVPEGVQGPPPRRPEEMVQEDPMRQMPPPPHLHPPPPFPPPPGHMPPDRRRP
ncbi:MAG: protein kinase domain-containing protein [Blastocatellia bacterium]